jgi:serine phosphatase RsbU (regulator of sigma subunit)
MTSRFRLPSPASAPSGGVVERLRFFLLQRWAGRVLLAVLGIELLARVGLPLPGVLTGPATLLFWLYFCWGLWRLGRFLVRRLLWRIRTKLMVSYLFIAVVPVVLLAVFFYIAGALFGGLVAGHMVTTEIDRTAGTLRAIVETALAALPADDAHAVAELRERLTAARALHPKLAFAFVRRGKALASTGEVPRSLPDWWKATSFAGLVTTEGRHVLRAVATQADAFLLVDIPLDADLFHNFEERTGVVISTVGNVRHSIGAKGRGISIDIDTKDKNDSKLVRTDQLSGVPFFVLPERTDWGSGRRDAEPLTFFFHPWDFARRLSPGAMNTADLLVKILAIVGVVFLVMYGVALLLGLLLARSVTKSVHALSLGTLRVRGGDLTHPIPITSRDQLGELAESFNIMASGIQDLMREQAEKQRLEEELRIARQIQMSLLPAEGVGLPGIHVWAHCLPAAEVGGDYYDLLPLSDTRMGVLIADVSGKGTSAALYMAELKGLVLSLSRMYQSPAKLLREANRILASTMDPRSFITMTYAVLDAEARTMRYARAGHNPIIHLDASSGRTRVLTPAGLGLGIDPGDRFDQILEEVEVPLRSGDVFLLFTDGLSEAMNESAEIFGERRLRDLVEQDGDAAGLKDLILGEIRRFVGGAAQHDDMTMVILQVA